MKLYTIHHDPAWIAPPGIGAFINGKDDRGGDNIADRGSFAEMRCHYWVWRNQRSDFVAFHHYRRAFLYPFVSVEPPLRRAAALFGCAQQLVCDPEVFRSYLAALAGATGAPRADIIIPRPAPLAVLESVPLDTPPTRLANLATQYRYHHNPADWELFETACRKEGLETRLPFLLVCNCFAMRWPLFDAYMTLWWRIFGGLGLTGDNKAPAYLSERLFTIWIADLQMRRPEVTIEPLPLLFCPSLKTRS